MTKHTSLGYYILCVFHHFSCVLTKLNPFYCAALCCFKAKYSFMIYTAFDRKHNNAI